jgi:serine/threonine protein kinase
MDAYKAKQMAAKLVGKALGNWKIEEYVNHGKSAVVFIAEHDGQRAAIKIFDPEIVDRFGRESQLKRIDRERSLIGSSHPNLIRVLDGGEAGEFLYVAMEVFEGPNLATALLDVPAENIGLLVAQLASAAKFLEDSSFAHRDIKPENIGVARDFRTVKLLDLGVMRPLDLSTVTDAGDQKLFIGTLQYSPPELLFREEEQSLEGWRAITFYQLGAILHDLIMRKPLFSEFLEPYARCVRAVEKEIPRIDAAAANPALRLLAQNCLSKFPRVRLETVKWEDFSEPRIGDPLEAVRKKISQHRAIAAESKKSTTSVDHNIEQQLFSLRTSIDAAVVTTMSSESLPRYQLLRVSKVHPYILRVVIEPSITHGASNYLAVYFVGEAVDPGAGHIELRIYACIHAAREAVPAEPASTAPARSIRGALIDQDIRSHVHANILLAFGDALGESSDTSDPKWLEIGAKE